MKQFERFRSVIAKLLAPSPRELYMTSFVPLQPDESDGNRRERVKELNSDEAAVYKWLREGYSVKWTAETVLRSAQETRAIARRMYRKLGVKGRRELIRAYGLLDKLGREPVEPADSWDV